MSTPTIAEDREWLDDVAERSRQAGDLVPWTPQLQGMVLQLARRRLDDVERLEAEVEQLRGALAKYPEWLTPDHADLLARDLVGLRDQQYEAHLELSGLRAEVARLTRERSALLDLLDAAGVDRAAVVGRLAGGEEENDAQS